MPGQTTSESLVLSPSPFREIDSSNVSGLSAEMQGDKDFMEVFNAVKGNSEIMASINRDLMSVLFHNENIPGEQVDDEFRFIDGNYQRPISGRMLRVAGRTEAARLIKNTRSLQMQDFSRPSYQKKDPGLALDFKLPGYKPSTEEKEKLKYFTSIFAERFFFPAFAKEANLGLWLSAAYNDWFDLDDITFEIRRRPDMTPLGFHLMDPVLVKTVIPDRNNVEYKQQMQRWDVAKSQEELKMLGQFGKTILQAKDIPSAKASMEYLLQNPQGTRIRTYTKDFMRKHHFFVSTNLYEIFRGYSIVEQGTRMLTNIMNTLNYNASNFTNNRTPQGMLALSGGFVNRLIVEQLKKTLYAYLGSPTNRHRLPVIGLPEKGKAQFIPFNMASREMEFHLWVTLLFTILCQLSGTNPEEVSMSSHGDAMRGNRLFEQSPDGVLQVSRDKGLNMFLYYIESIINSSGVLQEMTGMDIIARFNGLKVEDERVKIEVNNSKLASTHSHNQIIEEEGGDPEVLMYEDINVYDVKGFNNPNIFAVIQAKIAENKQKAEQRQQEIEMQQQSLEQQSQSQQPQPTDKDAELIKQYS